MVIYTIGGLGADYRVFEFLELEYPVKVLEWIEPLANESIHNYVNRLLPQIDTKKDFVIIGVSFGGIIAIEISKLLNPKLTILISSIQTHKGLPWIYKMVNKSQIIRILPAFMLKPPFFILRILFGAKNKKLLKSIIKDTDTSFMKWAISSLLNWKNDVVNLEGTIHISGTKDKLLPLKIYDNVIPIQKGGHFMIVDKADEISSIINVEMRNLL